MSVLRLLLGDWTPVVRDGIVDVLRLVILGGGVAYAATVFPQRAGRVPSKSPMGTSTTARHGTTEEMSRCHMEVISVFPRTLCAD